MFIMINMRNESEYVFCKYTFTKQLTVQCVP